MDMGGQEISRWQRFSSWGSTVPPYILFGFYWAVIVSLIAFGIGIWTRQTAESLSSAGLFLDIGGALLISVPLLRTNAEPISKGEIIIGRIGVGVLIVGFTTQAGAAWL